MQHLPPFNLLWENFSSNKQVKPPELLKEIGWDDLIDNPAFANTCAIRLSLALIKSGLTIPGGRMSIKAGPFKGKRIEPGQAKLSQILAAQSMLGSPEKYTGAHETGIGERSGIVSFFRLIPDVYDKGHIDLVMAREHDVKKCASDCWWASKEVWFWPMA